MERPNTVAGLLAKRKELAGLRAKLELDLKRVVCDLVPRTTVERDTL
jgi:hypothetical protein